MSKLSSMVDANKIFGIICMVLAASAIYAVVIPLFSNDALQLNNKVTSDEVTVFTEEQAYSQAVVQASLLAVLGTLEFSTGTVYSSYVYARLLTVSNLILNFLCFLPYNIKNLYTIKVLEYDVLTDESPTVDKDSAFTHMTGASIALMVTLASFATTFIRLYVKPGLDKRKHANTFQLVIMLVLATFATILPILPGVYQSMQGVYNSAHPSSDGDCQTTYEDLTYNKTQGLDSWVGLLFGTLVAISSLANWSKRISDAFRKCVNILTLFAMIVPVLEYEIHQLMYTYYFYDNLSAKDDHLCARRVIVMSLAFHAVELMLAVVAASVLALYLFRNRRKSSKVMQQEPSIETEQSRTRHGIPSALYRSEPRMSAMYSPSSGQQSYPMASRTPNMSRRKSFHQYLHEPPAWSQQPAWQNGPSQWPYRTPTAYPY